MAGAQDGGWAGAIFSSVISQVLARIGFVR
jgi:hypothetical protein